MNKPYRPSNSTDGECFFESWCCHCARDKAMREGAPIDECDDSEKCELIANSMAFDIDHPKYPKEWIYGDDGIPCCTAFIESWEGVPEIDTHTQDMFA